MDVDFEPGRLVTTVAGRARPRAEAVVDFDEGVAKLRQRYHQAVWPLFIPQAQDIFRWHLQLECGCTREVFTRGKDRFPDEGIHKDPLTGADLLSGERWCPVDHGVPVVYREIVEWLDPTVHDFPADPVEPPEGYDAETWAVIRHAEPHSSAHWRVRLDCGHVYDHVVTDVGWKPEDGPRLVSTKRREEMREELEDMWAMEGDECWPPAGPEREHFRRMLDLRCPRPEPEQECGACRRAKKITGYQRIGWLIPRSNKPLAPVLTEREKVEAKLAKAEDEVRRLRRQLGVDVGGKK